MIESRKIITLSYTNLDNMYVYIKGKKGKKKKRVIVKNCLPIQYNQNHAISVNIYTKLSKLNIKNNQCLQI